MTGPSIGFVCFLHHSRNDMLVGYVGQGLGEMTLRLYADADFAGCKATRRSTSGMFACLYGSNTMFPIAARCVKQGYVSHSTPEAEIVAGDAALRTIGLPLLDALEQIVGQRFILDFREDNTTMISVCKTGKNPTMRTLSRTHGVSVDWLHERFTTDP